MSELIRDIEGQLASARRGFKTLLDLNRVPDGDVLERDIEDAFGRLRSMLYALDPPAGDDGTLYYPIDGVDIRDCPTNRRVTARELFGDGGDLDPELRLQLISPFHLELPLAWQGSRVLSRGDYLRALREARPFELGAPEVRVN